MLIYNIIFIMFAIVSYCSIVCKSNPKIEKWMITFFILGFILLSAIRSNVGTDFQSYLKLYDSFAKWDFQDGVNRGAAIGYGYVFLNILIKSIFDNYFFMLLSVSLLCILIRRDAIIKLSDKYLLCLFIWWALSFCTIFPVRFDIAAAIFIYAIWEIQKKNLKSYIICVILATLFHPSALILLPSYYIYHKKFNMKHCTLIFVSIAGLMVGGEFALPFIGNVLGGVYAQRINDYMFINTSAYSYWFSVGKYILNKGSSLIVFTFIRRRYLNAVTNVHIEIFNGCYKLFIFGMLISLVTFPFSLVLGRAAAYFYILELIMIPHIFNIVKDRMSKTILFILLSIYLYLRLYTLVNSYGGTEFVYKTIFSLPYQLTL